MNFLILTNILNNIHTYNQFLNNFSQITNFTQKMDESAKKKKLPKKKRSSGNNEYLNFPDFHKYVKLELTKQGKSMSELADFLGYTRQGVYSALKSSSPNLIFLIVVSEYLNVSPATLVNDPTFQVPANLFGNYWWFDLFWPRFELQMKRSFKTWPKIADKFLLTQEELKAKISETISLYEYIKSCGSSSVKPADFEENLNLYLTDHYHFFVDLLYEVQTDPRKFFYLKSHYEPIFGDPESESLNYNHLPSRDDQLSLSEILTDFTDRLKFKAEFADTIIEYFKQRYPEDLVSKQLIEIRSWANIEDGSESHRDFMKIIDTAKRTQ